MAMAVDSRQQPQLGGMGYQHLQYPQQLYSTPLVSSAPDSNGRTAPVSLPYSGMPLPAPSLGADLLNHARSYAPQYTTATSATTYAPTSAPHYQTTYQFPQDQGRRSSHPSVPSSMFLDASLEAVKQRQSSLVDFHRLNSATDAQRQSYNDAVDASRGMIQMSQDLTTPRNIYGAQRNGSGGGDYGFPATHSAHSSISSASAGYGSYYTGSVADSSVTDYSSASESVDLNSRTLPRPSSLVGALPPAPQTMMGQFSSKVASSSQKKHKCKICDKRFTRPSSLQTHMYSHTGEKPFACEVEGCGRHFSVVSNLRRHKKVHRNDGQQDHPSPEE